MKKETVRPYLFETNPRAQPGETFKEIADDPTYSISNFGRIKSRRSSTPRIIKPYRRANAGKFFVRLSGQDFTSVADLVYKAFIGEISDLKKVVFIDGDARNVKFDNLKLVDRDFRTKNKRRTGLKYSKLVPIKDKITAKEIKVAYTSKNKSAKIIEINTLVRNGYYIQKHEPETKATIGLYTLRARKLK